MKKLLSALAIAAASTALAVESSNTFGILRVDSSAAQTIVSVPWEGAGGGSIKVKDVVKTANLNTGDQLYYYANGSYKMWQLNAQGQWEGTTVVKQSADDKTTIEASAGDDDPIVRGGAIILKRNNPIASCFYLYGQYVATPGAMTVVRGSEAAPAYSLVAPTTTANQGTELDSLASSYVDAKDTVMVKIGADMRILVCRNTAAQGEPATYKWGTEVKSGKGGTTTFTPANVTIPAGEGFWYVSRGGSLTAPAAE